MQDIIRMALDSAANDEGALGAIKVRLDSVDGGGPVARESVKRHYEHLERLAANLRRLGMDEHAIDENIMEVFQEYERELMKYVNQG